jgi:hypothetical protein
MFAGSVRRVNRRRGWFVNRVWSSRWMQGCSCVGPYDEAIGSAPGLSRRRRYLNGDKIRTIKTVTGGLETKLTVTGGIETKLSLSGEDIYVNSKWVNSGLEATPAEVTHTASRRRANEADPRGSRWGGVRPLGGRGLQRGRESLRHGSLAGGRLYAVPALESAEPGCNDQIGIR